MSFNLSSAMEAPEDVMGSHSSGSGTGDHSPPHPAVLKRKRSKRPPPSRAPPVAASSSSTSSADYLSSATEEEEDMAHCLILLAQGGALVDSAPSPPAEKFTSRRFTETTTTAGGKAGFYVYECKTCNKCFPSFQALGGHRASHKKAKMAVPTLTTAEDKNLTMKDSVVEGELDISINAFSKPVSAVNVPTANSPTNNKMRVHECSICRAEFSSGQALGGHMRRHRPIGAGPESSPSPTQEVVVLKKERNVLSLDLNLPAPADENPQPPPPAVAASFSFPDKRPMVFSATSAAALVDCHY